MNICWIHTFWRSGCDLCDGALWVQMAMYGQAYFGKTHWGLLPFWAMR